MRTIMRTIEEDLEFEEVYRVVREDRQAKEIAARQGHYKLLPIDDPHAMDELRSVFGKLACIPTGGSAQLDWRERAIDALKHDAAERGHLFSQLRRIRKHLEDGNSSAAIAVAGERFPGHDAFGWNACQQDTAEAHRIIAERKRAAT